MMTLPIEIEGQLWKQALKYFGADELRHLLIKAQDDFYLGHDFPLNRKATKWGRIFTVNGTAYCNFRKPMLRKVFGPIVLAFIRNTPDLRLNEGESGKLEMPERLRIHLSGALLRKLPAELLNDTQRDQLFASDIGL